mmetsp:Transcript_4887/g.11552  ORF Transcript_4887/g.11552 Transcript_4887/m.11552 type:complete len:252 (-) Transcript_4887:1074-1829(-)
MSQDVLEHLSGVLSATGSTSRGIQLALHVPNCLAEGRPLFPTSVFQHLLDNVVAIGVGAHGVDDLGPLQHHSHQQVALLLDQWIVRILTHSRRLEALLDHIAGELFLREFGNVCPNRLNNSFLVFLAAVLQHVLHNIIAISILCQHSHIHEDFLQHWFQLCRYTVFEKPLNHTTAVHVPCRLFCLLLHRFDNEVNGVRRHLLDAFLDHVISMHVPDAGLHVILQLPRNLLLGLFGDCLNRLLDDTAAILVL